MQIRTLGSCSEAAHRIIIPVMGCRDLRNKTERGHLQKDSAVDRYMNGQCGDAYQAVAVP
jgi:hypothetical protein